MSIKRGVSSYSYQNLIFDRKMYWKDYIKAVHDLDTDGIEIIDETFINGYPFLSDEFVYDWHNEIARYNMKPVTIDIYLDVLQFRDHVMNHAEAIERLKRDLVIASKLGFQNVRCLVTVPLDVIEACLETAEEVNVRIGQEIHAPIQLNYNPDAASSRQHFDADPEVADHMIEMIERTGTKYAGLVPDMGLFQHNYTPSMIESAKRSCGNPDCVDFIVENHGKVPAAELNSMVAEKFPGVTSSSLARLIQPQGSAQPEELLKVIPYTLSIHGKFYEMVEDPENPGHYYDPSIDYAGVFKYLKMGCYDGYIDSEFEGQRDRNDLPDDEMFDEVEQVRRQHAMFRDLGAI